VVRGEYQHDRILDPFEDVERGEANAGGGISPDRFNEDVLKRDFGKLTNQLCGMIVRSLRMSMRCFGILSLLLGQNRDPFPPAIMTANIVLLSSA
jgi:hypothetical protein